MGTAKTHIGNGNFSTYLYTTVSGTTFEMYGMKFKVIKLEVDKDGKHTSFPLYSKTSNGYLCLGEDGLPKQLRMYDKNHRAIMDFDWGHTHYNNPKNGGNGELFSPGVVHVQEFSSSSYDRLSSNARYMNNEEIATIGNIIRHYNPNVKFRP